MLDKLALQRIDKAYSALAFLDSVTWTRYRETCFTLAQGEERNHRRNRPAVPGFSIAEAARLFVVRRIAEELVTPKATVADILRYQPSAMYAAAIVATYRNKVQDAWATAGIDLPALLAIDYAKLMENRTCEH